MARFLLLMRGDQTKFLSLSHQEQQKVVEDHESWAAKLRKSGNYVDGDGIGPDTITLHKGADNNIDEVANQLADSPDQLSGYYIIEADDINLACTIAKQCPALNYGERIEVAPLGH